MRVQSKRWFRRNRHKSPKLVKVLQCINKLFPRIAHLIEIEFDQYHNGSVYINAWLYGDVVATVKNSVVEVTNFGLGLIIYG